MPGVKRELLGGEAVGGIRQWVRKSVHRSEVKFIDRLGPFVGAVVLFLIGTLVIVVAWTFHIGGLTDFVAWVAAALIGCATVFVQARVARHNAILGELTAGYILSGR